MLKHQIVRGSDFRRVYVLDGHKLILIYSGRGESFTASYELTTGIRRGTVESYHKDKRGTITTNKLLKHKPDVDRTIALMDEELNAHKLEGIWEYIDLYLGQEDDE